MVRIREQFNCALQFIEYAVLLIIERDRRSTFAFCDKICGQTGSENDHVMWLRWTAACLSAPRNIS